MWAVYNRYADNFDRYLPYALGYEPLDKVEVMPLWIIPKTKLGVKDVIACLRDHYEGTPMAMNNDLGQGLYESPFRPTPLHYSIDGVDCFNERPIATMQTSFTWVSQMRNWLPREVGGVLWWANDDGDMVPYTPIYCNNTTAPHCYNTPGADAVTYSDENAYWVCNWVSNMVYPRYSLLYPELASVRDSLEASYYDLQPKIEAKAIERLKTDREGALLMLNDYSNSQAENMLQAWQELATRIIVGYNDGIKKTVDDKGHFKTSENGFRPVFTRPGYPINIGRELIRTTGDRFIVPDEKKKEPEKAEIQVCSGSIDLYKKFGSLNITPRDVMVWLPEGYKVGDECDVLYMHDGQMLFDAASTWNHQEWQVDEVASRLIDEGKIRKCIIVGINNTDARLDEYFPDKALQFVDKDKCKGVNVGQFKGGDYLRFIVEELKPFIDEHYKPLTTREHTMMMGSSMGGLISLYAICEYPQVFGAVACLSTHLSLQLPCNGGDLDNWSAGFYDYLTYRLPKANNSIVYMDRGTEDIDIPYAPFQTRVDKLFLDEGWNSKHYLSKVFDGQGHNEKSWASRLHNPLLFLLGNK